MTNKYKIISSDTKDSQDKEARIFNWLEISRKRRARVRHRITFGLAFDLVVEASRTIEIVKMIGRPNVKIITVSCH